MLSKPATLAIGAVVSYVAAIGLGALLIQGAVESTTTLAAIYVAYALLTVVTLHCCGFGLPLWFEFPLGKRVPKYLEYAYIVLILVSLLDILNFGPRYYLYLSRDGDESALLARITAMAESQLKDNCGKGPQRSRSFHVETVVDFSQEYCKKLAGLVVPTQQRDVALKFAKDQEFMGHIVTRTATTVRGEVSVMEFGNDIAGLIQRFSVLDTFHKSSSDPESEAFLKLISMLLFPIGIGLRALKTSLELFADLK